MTALLRTFDGMLPMQLGVAKECRVFLLSCLIGASLGLLYQILCIARVILPHFKWAIFAEDLFFGLFCGFCYFLLFSYFSLNVRGFIAFGMILSGILIHILIGKPVLSLVKAVDGKVKAAVLKPAAHLFVKIIAKIKRGFVQEYKKYNIFKKTGENRLKESAK